MKQILGKAWLTSLCGYIVAGVTAAGAVLPANGDLSHVDWGHVASAVFIAVWGRVTNTKR